MSGVPVLLKGKKMKNGSTIIDCIKYKKRDEELTPDWRRRTAVVDGTQLWSASPAVVLVQPRSSAGILDFEDTFQNRYDATVAINDDVTLVTPYSGRRKSNSVRLLRISPNFANFLHGENEATRRLSSEKSRGGYRTYPRVLEDDNLLKSRSNLKKTWNFEDIIKEIESDSFRITPSPTDLLETPSPVPETFGSDDVFIEIPLQGEDLEENKVESPKEVERKTIESKEALSKLFDQLLADVYNQRLNPPTGVWSLDEPRRCSETKLVEIRRWEGKRIFRQLSFPGHDALEGKRYFGVNQLQMPVRSLSGINQSNPGVEEFVDFNVESGKAGQHQETVEKLTAKELNDMDLSDVKEIRSCLEKEISYAGACLVEELKEKDALVSDQEGLCEIVTAYLQAISTKTSEDAKVQFSLSPAAADSSGFQEWARAMRMVARLPDGVPAHFRKNLWLSLAERHLHSKGIVWNQIERRLFSDTTTPEDKELSVQIVKDLHRTGCSLFCGVTGQHNQAVLKRVLVAYARWNKNVGYCQGLNMLAAIILQVMQGSQSATVKVMIYLIEGVLPESYFANNLRGLSVDMAVFRDLLRLKLPKLSKHLDRLQQDSKDSGTSYEPPLCDVFTMQWFLTLFSNCLPQPTVLRVWDLVFLEGDHVLLKTSLAIWQCLSDRLVGVRSADEFYSIMAVMTREMMEFGLMEPNSLINAIDNMAVPEVPELREKYIYNISPWAVGTVAKMGVKLLYPDVASQGNEDIKESKTTPFSNHPDREKIALDISALKRQYWKLRERQRQAHIILTACRSETLTANNSPALNHLLLGKRALLSAKGRRIEGTVPQPMNKSTQPPGGQKPRASTNPSKGATVVKESGTTIHWRQTRSRRGGTSRSPTPSSASSSASSSSSSTELCDSSSDSEEFLPPDETSQSETNLEAVQSEVVYDERAEHEVKEENEPEQPLPPVLEEPVEKYTERSDEPEHPEIKKSELALRQILQENSEILQRIHKSHNRNNSEDESETNDTKVTPSRSGRRDSGSAIQSPDEPDDIKDIRRRYAVRQTSSLDSPNPCRPSNRNLDGVTGYFASSSSSLPSVPTPSLPVFRPFPTAKAKPTETGVKLGLYESKNSIS